MWREGVTRFYSLLGIMSDARRATRRVRLPGILVAYETATGERHQARVMDLSRDGLYIPSSQPLAVGKRLSLEIQPIGEPTAWSALGRVVWVRDVDDGNERPAGMAIKFVDVEDQVVAAIERLLEAREPTERGLGLGSIILAVPPVRSNPPAREPTMLGVGPDVTAVAAAPIMIAAPEGERTLAGVGKAEAGAHSSEVSLAIDLVARKDGPVRAPHPEPVRADVNEANGTAAEEPKSSRPSGAQEGAAERSLVEPAAKGRSWRAAIVFALLIAGGVAGYTFRDPIRALSHVAVSTITKHPQ